MTKIQKATTVLVTHTFKDLDVGYWLETERTPKHNLKCVSLTTGSGERICIASSWKGDYRDINHKIEALIQMLQGVLKGEKA